jgi:16S rRNA processing protein RimM
MAVQGDLNTGKISKPYGLRGEVQIILNPASASHIKEGIPLFIDLDGQRIPFFIEEVDLVSLDQAIVKMEFIDSIEEARRVSGCDVYIESGKHTRMGHGADSPMDLVGYAASDLKLGAMGKITEYIHNEMNPVWLIEFRGKELMVPAVAKFIRKINHREKNIELDLPEGLTDL